ncbi:MAG: hypothetical protein OEM77_04500 [Nitrosopumilus sp.]|nr:hypothetical protein [Nitrosopumilus sp.]MDH3823107.1 hypothetical protein [Nitrosopumilus sp.]MDH3834276.1 hypothetical protein [Nitrosopumilus sp.]
MTLFYSLVFFTIFLSFNIIPAFAENPTPYNEWDFDFMGVTVFQDPNNLNTLIISIPVGYHGEMLFGTVEINTIVTNPDGKIKPYSDLIRDMKIGGSQVVEFKHRMLQEGTYTVEMNITPPSDPHMGHIFDTENQTFTVEPNGFERAIKAVVLDSDEMVSYNVEKPTTVKNFEVLHAVIDLPKEHTFEKIIVENGSIVEYPIDQKDIYIDSKSGYHDIKVNLLRQNNLLPTVGAQDTFEDFVKFYAVVEDVCYSVDCVTIHDVTNDVTEKPEEFQWMFIIILAAVVTVTAIGIYFGKMCKNLKNKQNLLAFKV